ncbi:MAG: MFS transporter [Halieaceae bacterium]|jgi:Na+/melibiose symporter-like transporter|nr:MFS transporter [Halieaceae bacterium]
MPKPRAMALRYGLGSVGAGLYASVPGVLLLFYLTEVLRLDAGAAALAVFIPKLLGAACDPLAGILSDRTTSAWGRRFPWMAAGGLLMPAALAMVFSGWAGGASSYAAAFIAVAYALSAVGYSLFAVPYLAMPAEMHITPTQRLAVISRRMFFAMAGIMLGSAGAPWLVSHFGGGEAGYRFMGLAVAICSGICIAVSVQLAFVLGKGELPVAGAQGLRSQLRTIAGNRPFVQLLAVFSLQTLSATVFGALVPYAVTLLWAGDEARVGLLMFCLLLSSMVALSAWEAVAARGGQANAFVGAATLYLLSLTPLLFIDGGSPVALQAGAFAFIGVGFAGLQLLPFSMAANLIHLHASSKGERNEAAFTGAWTALEKVALSLGAPAAAVVVSVARQDTGGVAAGDWPEAIVYGLIVIPAAAQLISIAVLLRWRALAQEVTA